MQWMTAGRGLLHEEMWRTGDAGPEVVSFWRLILVKSVPKDTWESSDQELFQIWVACLEDWVAVAYPFWIPIVLPDAAMHCEEVCLVRSTRVRLVYN